VEGNIVAPKKAKAELVSAPDNSVAARVMAGGVELPGDLADKIDAASWLNSILTRAQYIEPDSDYLARAMLIQTLSGATVEDIFAESGLLKLQDEIQNFAGATSGPVEICDLYVTGSDFGEGMPCYMILDVRDMETGEVRRFSTGASGLQTQVFGMIVVGNWPIQCQIVRIASKDKGGRHLLKLFPVE